MVRVALIAGALGLLTTALMSSISISVANRALTELRRQHDQIDLLAALRATILEARSEHRAYLLTADTAVRAAFQAADQRAVQAIDSLTRLARTDSALRPRLARLRSCTTHRVADASLLVTRAHGASPMRCAFLTQATPGARGSASIPRSPS